MFDSFIPSYHVHVYYDAISRDLIQDIRAYLFEQFPDNNFIDIGRMHDHPIGPHPQAQFRIAIHHTFLQFMFNFFMKNRQGLTVLIHPETGDDIKDHTDHLVWLGTPLILNITRL